MKSLYQRLAIIFLCFISALSGYSQAGMCGNGSSAGINSPCNCPPVCPGSNPFNPFTGNEHREIKDLEVWGAVGEIPLVLKRYSNSRGETRWEVSFNYIMSNPGPNSSGQARIDVRFPEGGENIFTQSTADPTKWLPVPGVNRRVFQNGTDFFLQLADGSRYRFLKIGTGSNYYFQLQDFRDSYQNLYTVTYGPNNNIIIKEPAGRYIEITYGFISGNLVVINMATSDGRSAQPVYHVLNDGINLIALLDSVKYGDGTKASYTYHQISPGSMPNLEHAIDPRVEGTATDMIYTYLNIPTHGYLKEEKNGFTGQLMASFDGSLDARMVCYPTGCQQIYNMPENQTGRTDFYTDRVGNTTHYTYGNGGTGFLQSITDPLGRVTTYNLKTVYDNPLKITYPDGSTEEWTRDDLDLVLSHKDELGRLTTYTRDSRHRPTRIDYADGTFETFTYNFFSEVLDHQKKNGSIEHFVYDVRGLKTSYTDCDGKITTYTYDAADRLASITDTRGNTTQYQYNERGLMTKMTNADASFQTYTYDAFGNQTSRTDELTHTWSTTFDEFKRPKTMTDPLGRTTTYGYDLPGGICGCSHTDNKPTKITLPSGRITEIEYDHEWRKIRETVGLGTADAASTYFQYDAVGNMTQITDPRLKNWLTSYDVRDRKKSSADPLGNQTQWTYDFVGNVLTVKRPDNGTTTNVYDNLNRLIQTTDPKAQITKMFYDADGNMTKLTDPKNNDYTFQYDCLDRKTKMIYPDASFEQYTYDPVSNMATYKNRNGDIRTYTYDNRNRETNSSWTTIVAPSVATPSITRTYDADSRLITMTSSVSALSYAYNNANELLSETQAVTGNATKTVNYTYNADGLRNNMTYPDATVISYSYTNRNQISSISQGAPVTQYTYDVNGNRISKTLNNGTNTQYTYDDANRMLNLDNKKTATSFARFDYGYDNVNRRKFIQYDNANGDVYSYDAIDQVTDVKYDVTNPGGVPGAPVRTVNYGLDASGNRTTVTDNAVPTNYTTNNLNEYTNVGGGALTYNPNGSLQTFNGYTYTYDAQGRLTRADNGITTVDFLYDARNRCVKRTISGAQRFLYYDKWNLIDERNFADAQLNRYVHGAMTDEVLTKTSPPSNTVYYHYDALGNLVRLTDNTGTVVEKYSYDIFGAPTIKDGTGTVVANSVFGNRFMFTGREYIQESGLYDYRNRMYHSMLGRFLQTDPLRFDANDVNLYRYVGNNSVNQIDLLGTCCWPLGQPRPPCWGPFWPIGQPLPPPGWGPFWPIGQPLPPPGWGPFWPIGQPLPPPGWGPFIPINAPSRNGMSGPSGFTKAGMQAFANGLAQLTPEQARFVADWFNNLPPIYPHGGSIVNDLSK